MSASDASEALASLPEKPHGQGHAAHKLIREWRRRFDTVGGGADEALPAFRDALEAVGYEFHVLKHAPEGRSLTLQYDPPEAIDRPGRDVELVVSALRSVIDREKWLDGGVTAESDTHAWELGRQGLRRWDAKGSVDHALDSLEPLE